ncbi:uncharacterized protein [Labrus bergylta]|uniref:uncharacterized protein n=1 Tax=Labrus bergylta TaxID=56723 RepID=UPI003313AFD3
MFSDSRAPAPGEQKGFKPHTPHFIPWLRNSLKPHQSGDIGLNGQFKSGSEARNNLTPLERAKGIGFFSIQGKDRAKKGDLRCNGVGMARMLPVVLRGHNILQGSLGKQREESPARWNHSPELQPDPSTQISPEEAPQDVSKGSTRNHSGTLQPQNDRASTKVRKYGPLVGPPPAPAAEEKNCKVPVVMGMEDRSKKLWDYSSNTTHRHRDLHSSSWVGTDRPGLLERQHGFTSSFSYIKQQSRNSQSQRDLREPPVDGFHRPLNGVLFSTEVPQSGLGCTTTLQRPRKARQSLEHISILGQNQTWVQYRKKNGGESQKTEGGCSRKVVRKQIKRVVDNLEQVLTALRDVQQEMREVVHQIDYLTSSIDLNDEEQWRTERDDSDKPSSDSSSGSGSSTGDVMVGSTNQRPSGRQHQPGASVSSGTLRRDHCYSRSQSPPNALLCPSRTLRFTCSLGSSPRRGGRSLSSSNPPHLQNHASNDPNMSPQRILPVRPPTPGLSPLTINLHHSNSPSSQPHSPVPLSSIRVSPPSTVSLNPPPPSINHPSVIKENKVGEYETPKIDNQSVQSPSASCPPTEPKTQPVSDTDRERRASSAGPVHRTSEAKLQTGQCRRSRKPPPYPHHRLSDPTEKVKEPRKAPPYPEKRRLLSTTV